MAFLRRRAPFESVYFHHIGKTGGTSLDAALKQAFRRWDVYRAHSLTEDLLKRRYRYVSGHMPWQTRELLPQPNLTITTIREPIAHILSTFRHLQRQPDHIFTLSATKLTPNFTLDDFLADAGVRRYIQNPQTLSIARRFPWDRFLRFCHDTPKTDFRTATTLTDPRFVTLYGDPDEERSGDLVYAKALDHLQNPATLMLPVESLDAQMPFVLRLATGRKEMAQTPRLNVSTQEPIELTDMQRATITEMTQLDQKLYELAHQSTRSHEDYTLG